MTNGSFKAQHSDAANISRWYTPDFHLVTIDT